jgi:hypothetical protein
MHGTAQFSSPEVYVQATFSRLRKFLADADTNASILAQFFSREVYVQATFVHKCCTNDVNLHKPFLQMRTNGSISAFPTVTVTVNVTYLQIMKQAHAVRIMRAWLSVTQSDK